MLVTFLVCLSVLCLAGVITFAALKMDRASSLCVAWGCAVWSALCVMGALSVPAPWSGFFWWYAGLEAVRCVYRACVAVKP